MKPRDEHKAVHDLWKISVFIHGFRSEFDVSCHLTNLLKIYNILSHFRYPIWVMLLERHGLH